MFPQRLKRCSPGEAPAAGPALGTAPQRTAWLGEILRSLGAVEVPKSGGFHPEKMVV